jgi:hypothetical protein
MEAMHCEGIGDDRQHLRRARCVDVHERWNADARYATRSCV